MNIETVFKQEGMELEKSRPSEIELVMDVKANKQGFYRCICRKTSPRENVNLLLTW